MALSLNERKRRSFIVTVPVWIDSHSGRDATLTLLRETMAESFSFGDPENDRQKATVRPLPNKPAK